MEQHAVGIAWKLHHQREVHMVEGRSNGLGGRVRGAASGGKIRVPLWRWGQISTNEGDGEASAHSADVLRPHGAWIEAKKGT